MVTRTPAGNAKLFKEQYGLLRSAVNGCDCRIVCLECCLLVGVIAAPNKARRIPAGNDDD